MIHKYIPFIIFTIFFLLLSNWHVFVSTLSGIGKPGYSYSKLEDSEIKNYILDKTGVEINTFYLVNSDKFFAGMTGVPGKPIMTISESLYNSFTPEELNYVLLHETGNYALLHSVKEVLIYIVVIVVAFFVFRSIPLSLSLKTTLAVIVALISGIGVIQGTRNFEWSADKYALEKLENPEAMITATEKFKTSWLGDEEVTLTWILFKRSIPYNLRIEFAKKYLNK